MQVACLVLHGLVPFAHRELRCRIAISGGHDVGAARYIDDAMRKRRSRRRLFATKANVSTAKSERHDNSPTPMAHLGASVARARDAMHENGHPNGRLPAASLAKQKRKITHANLRLLTIPHAQKFAIGQMDGQTGSRKDCLFASAFQLYRGI
jgi:hypothetical protein